MLSPPEQSRARRAGEVKGSTFQLQGPCGPRGFSCHHGTKQRQKDSIGIRYCVLVELALTLVKG